MRLYTVTMLESEREMSRGPIAVCLSREAACGIVEGNDLDIHETNHDYAVISVVGSDSPYGLLSVADGEDDVEEVWYRWSGTAWEGKYERCNKPASLERVRFGL